MSEGIRLGGGTGSGGSDTPTSCSMRDGVDALQKMFGRDVFTSSPQLASALLAAYMDTEAKFALAREAGRIADALNNLQPKVQT